MSIECVQKNLRVLDHLTHLLHKILIRFVGLSPKCCIFFKGPLLNIRTSPGAGHVAPFDNVSQEKQDKPWLENKFNCDAEAFQISPGECVPWPWSTRVKGDEIICRVGVSDLLLQRVRPY